MKTPFPPSRRSGGFALVITLAILVLLTFLVTAFFSSASRDHQETENYADTTGADQLASAAINLVISQIREATAGFPRAANGDYQTNDRLAWASQPGMIRNYDSNGNPYRYYKLYSSESMVIENPSGAFSDLPPSDWYNQPALYTDLNEPVLLQDPDSQIERNGVAHRAVYPIVDPALQSRPLTNPERVNAVEGFEITPLDGYAGPGEPNQLQTHDPTQSPQSNWAAMPVRWLYMLEDGKLVPPMASGSDIEVTGASASNPIVARVAFWTDDETAKVNVNTASEGVFWDIPRAYTSEETALGEFQPVRNEFQRFPGHPSMTSLSAVFPALDPGKPGLSADQRQARYEVLYGLSPRVKWGGSEAASKAPRNPEAFPDGGPMGLDTERLLPSIGDAAYGTELDEDGRRFATLEEALKEALQVEGSGEPLKGIGDRDFFLTTNSRAPETNLWNLPRISLWPLNSASRSNFSSDDNARQNPYDRLLKFCSTLGGRDYFFLRANNWSTTDDFDEIERNQQLFEYLDRLTSTDVPGFGGNFNTKVGATNRKGILTQMIDYIRSLPDPVNTFLTTRDGKAPYGYTNTADYGWNNTIYAWNGGGLTGVVAPLKITDSSGTYTGFGNFPIITQVAVVFRTESTYETESPSDYLDDGIVVDEAGGTTAYRLRAYLYVFTYNPANRFGAYNPSNGSYGKSGSTLLGDIGISVRIAGQSGFNIAAVSNGASGGGGFTFATAPVPMVNSGDYYAVMTGDTAFYGPDRLIPDQEGGTSGTEVGGELLMSTNRVTLNFPTPEIVDGGGSRPYLNTDMLPVADTQVRAITMHDTQSEGFRFGFQGGSVELELLMHNEDKSNPEVVRRIEVEFPPVGSLVVPNQDWSDRLSKLKGNEPNRGPADMEEDETFSDASSLIKAMTGPLWQLTRELRSETTNYKINAGRTSSSILYHEPTTVIRGVQLALSQGPLGDWRLAGLQSSVPSSWFEKADPDTYDTDAMVSFDTYYSRLEAANVVEDSPFHNSFEQRAVSSKQNGILMASGAPGDWNNNYAAAGEGALINPPDFGSTGRTALMLGYEPGDDELQNTGADKPHNQWSYFNFNSVVGDGGKDNQHRYAGTFYQYYTTFSPNRQMYSAMQFGSLLSEPYTAQPWQTLLFSPVSAASAAGFTHPGSESPPDHLLADLFWMPVVDPYPISEPMSTAGKINLNYQIQPFTNIERRTGLHALLKSMKLFAVPTDDSNVYKDNEEMGRRYRYDIDIARTLDQIDAEVFDQGAIFRSATQISEVLFRPEDVASDLLSWWDTQRMTGDDSREMPYAQLHPRLTTKSNTYRIHYRVQKLKKRDDDPDQDLWKEERDRVVGEQRGSALVERFIDPNDANLPDFATLSLNNPDSVIDRYYRFRVLQRSRFNP